jgi:hypothetical protein
MYPHPTIQPRQPVKSKTKLNHGRPRKATETAKAKIDSKINSNDQ